MKTIIVLFLAFLAVSEAYNATYYTVKEPIDHKYIVVLWPQYDVNEVTKILETDTSGIFKDAIIKWRYKKVLNGFSVKLSLAGLAKVRAMTQVKYVTQDGVARTQAVASWGLDRVDQKYLPLDGAASFKYDGSGVNVYVIDTGIYPQSLYFENRADAAFDSFLPPGDTAYGVDCNGHGTHCAGTVGSNPYGVAPGVSLHGVRVLGCSGSGSNSDVIAGCDYVATEARFPAVASMSLGGGASTATDEAVQGMIDAGIPVAVAAGNSNEDACYSSPARAPNAITVGATDSDDTRASFSNYGECLDIFAPGISIPSAFIGGPEVTRTLSGTSMACPHVAGAAAMALQVFPTYSPKDVTDLITTLSTKKIVQNRGKNSPNNLLYIP